LGRFVPAPEWLHGKRKHDDRREQRCKDDELQHDRAQYLLQRDDSCIFL
jgi:hypothetical protein